MLGIQQMRLPKLGGRRVSSFRPFISIIQFESDLTRVCNQPGVVEHTFNLSTGQRQANLL